MSNRARALSYAENLVPSSSSSLAGLKRAVLPQASRAVLGSINVNTRHASVSTDEPTKEQVKSKGIVRRTAKENEPTVQKEVEYEVEGMETSVLQDAVMDEAQEQGQVENIDAEDIANPQLVTEYVNEIYSYLRSVETVQCVNHEYLAGQVEILPKMRAVLIDWLVGVHLQFHLLQETLYTTVAILDRYLQADLSTVSRKRLQLVGVAAMLIAAKYEEIYAPEVKDFVYITDRAYTEKEILRMEIRVLATLNFDLGRPLPLHFLRRASKAGGVDAATHTLAKYIVELSLGVYSLSHVVPSKVASAGLALAIRLLEPGSNLGSVWSLPLEHYTKYTMEGLRPLVVQLAEVLFLAPSAKLATVYNKYSNKKFMKISRIPVLDDPALRKIAKGEQL